MMHGFDEPELAPMPELHPPPLPTDPDELAELNRQVAVTAALADDEAVDWLIRETLPEPLRADADRLAFGWYASMALQARERALPFAWLWAAIRKAKGIDGEADERAIARWEALRVAMQRMSSPRWRPDR